MAKRYKLRLNKKQRRQLIARGIPFAAALAGLLIGIAGTKLLSPKQPANLVWAADSSVNVPKDLRDFLASQKSCSNYRGPKTPTGVGLWGVYQVSKGKYAKIAYGCSWNLSSYIMAVKDGNKWQLLQPKDYFAPFKDAVDPSKGALPYCAVIEKYNIPKDIEPFCIKADGSAQGNQL